MLSGEIFKFSVGKSVDSDLHFALNETNTFPVHPKSTVQQQLTVSTLYRYLAGMVPRRVVLRDRRRPLQQRAI